jgi:hypothetical protein
MSGKVTIALVALGLAMAGYVYLVEARREAAETTAADAEGKLVPLGKDDIVRMELPLATGGTVVLLRLRAADGPDGAAWRIEAPLATGADGFAVDGLLTAVAQLRIEFVVQTPEPDPAMYGFAPDGPEIVLTPSSGEPIRMALGDETPVEDNRYVRLSTRPDVVLGVRRGALRSLAPDLGAVRDKSLIGIAPRLVGEVEVARQGMPDVTLVRSAKSADADGTDVPLGEGTWELSEPELVPADSGRVFRFLQELYFARASHVIDAPGDAAQYGLAEPVATISLRAIAEGGLTGPTVVAIGRAGDKVYAQVDGRAPVFETPARLLEMVPDTLFDYRFKRVISIQPSTVAAVDLTFPRTNDTVRFERDGDSWVLASDSGLTLRAYRVTDLVYSFEAMDAIAVEQQTTGLKRLGLDPPQVRATLRDDAGAELGSLRLGTPDAVAGVPAISSRGPTIWRIVATPDAPIPQSYDTFLQAWIEQPEDAAPEFTGTPEELGLGDSDEDFVPPTEEDASADAP